MCCRHWFFDILQFNWISYDTVGKAFGRPVTGKRFFFFLTRANSERNSWTELYNETGVEEVEPRGCSMGEPDAQDEPRSSVDSAFQTESATLSSLMLTFSFASCLQSPWAFPLTLSVSVWLAQSTANPLRLRLTQELMRLGHYKLLFPSLRRVLPFIYYWLLICLSIIQRECKKGFLVSVKNMASDTFRWRLG